MLKKNLLKMLAIVLAFCMLPIQTLVFADGYDVGVLYSDNELTDTPRFITYFTNAEFTNWGHSGTDEQLNSSSCGMGLYKIPLPKLAAGQVIDEYVFTCAVYQGTDGFPAKSQIRFLKFDGDWASWGTGTTNGTDRPELYGEDKLFKYGNINTAWANWNALSAGYDESITITPHSETEIQYYSADISSYARESADAGKDYIILGVSPTVSCYLMGKPISEINIGRNVSPKYSFKLKQADPLSLQSSDISDGDEDVSCTETMDFTFNNSITTAEASINNSSVACDINGSTVSITPNLNQYTDYELELNVTDNVGQQLKITKYFATGALNTVADSSNGELWQISGTAVPAKVTYSTEAEIINTNNTLALAKIPIPQLSENELVTTFVMDIYGFALGGLPAYKFSGENWDLDNMKYTDDNVAACLNDENYIWALSAKQIDSGNNIWKLQYEFADYLNECRANGQQYMYIGFTKSYTTKMYGFEYPWNNRNIKYTYTTANAEIRGIYPEAVVNGDTLSSASFDILTLLDNADGIVLREKESKDVISSAEFTLDSCKVSLAAPIKLDEETSYEIIIAGNTTDKFGNVLDADYIVTEFTTKKNYEISAPKMIAAVDGSAYDDAVHITEASLNNEYKFIIKAANNTSSEINAVLYAAIYSKEDGSLLSLIPCTLTFEGESSSADYYSADFNSGSTEGCVKAFLWDADLRPLAAVAETSIK